MKKTWITLTAFFLCYAGLHAQQQNRALLMLGDVRLSPGDSVEPALLRNLCALQLTHPDWKVAVKPQSFQVLVSSKESQMREKCIQGKANEKLSARLQKLKTGDLLLLDHFQIPESVRAYAMQYILVVK